MTYESVSIDPAAADAALRAWQASVEALRSTVVQRSRAIEAAETARPWGGDSSGQQFGSTYADGALPSRTAVSATAGQLDNLGQQVRTAVLASLASDDEQAAALQPAQDALDPR